MLRSGHSRKRATWWVDLTWIESPFVLAFAAPFPHEISWSYRPNIGLKSILKMRDEDDLWNEMGIFIFFHLNFLHNHYDHFPF